MSQARAIVIYRSPGPVMIESANCPCSSALPYDICCARYHTGTLAPNAQLLMQSRYAAYAKQLIDYIIKTSHPALAARNRDASKWKQELLKFVKATKFNGLKINEFIDGETQASVTFTAFLMQGGRDVSFTEKSTFLKVGDAWLYHSGEKQKRPL